MIVRGEPPVSPGGYRIIDLIRALAAFTVVIGHAVSLFLIAPTPEMSAPIKLFYIATGYGHYAVLVFFVVSGFWITSAVVRRHDAGTWRWSTYMTDRLSRLWIVLIPALVICGLMDLYGRYILGSPLYLGQQGTVLITSDVANLLTPEIFLGNVLFLQRMVVPAFGTNGPLWSLANEFWYYIWFPALLGVILKPKAIGAVAILLFAIGVAVAFPALIPGFVCWLCGSALFFALHCLPLPSRLNSTPARLVILAASAVTLGAGAIALRVLPLGVWGDLACAAAIALILYGILASRMELPQRLDKIADFGAGSSFSLYVVHTPFLALIAAFVTPVTRFPPGLQGLAVVVAVLVATLIWAWIFSLATEKHTDRVRKLLRPRRTPETSRAG